MQNKKHDCEETQETKTLTTTNGAEQGPVCMIKGMWLGALVFILYTDK